MDQSGFLVMHPDFMLPSAEAIDVEHVHITQKEKSIAIDLVSHGYLVKRTCRHVESIREQSFYELHLPPEGFSTLHSNQGCKYELSQIPGTNVYLGWTTDKFLVIHNVFVPIARYSNVAPICKRNGVRRGNISRT